MASPERPLVLIVERNRALKTFGTIALEVAGYRVETPPEAMDVLTFVEQTHPQVIVLGIHSAAPQDRSVLARLQASPNARDIPVVVVAPDRYLMALAKAVPITSATVAHPFQVEELENAVRKALHNPPPAAVLPSATHPASAVVHFVTEELAKNAHRLVIETVRELREDEAYHSLFAHVLPDLVDNLGKMLGAITQGLRRNLPPAEVFSQPSLQRSIAEHVELRKQEGIDALSMVGEYQLLSIHVSRFLARLVEQGQLTIHDFIQLRERVQRYVDELVRQVIRYFASNNQPEP